jgi:hypothetical protein
VGTAYEQIIGIIRRKRRRRLFLKSNSMNTFHSTTIDA